MLINYKGQLTNQNNATAYVACKGYLSLKCLAAVCYEKLPKEGVRVLNEKW